jgi:molecular chaperone GrpE
MKKNKNFFANHKVNNHQKESNEGLTAQETESEKTETEKMTASEMEQTAEMGEVTKEEITEETKNETTEPQSPNIEEYQKQINELQDKYIRLMAEFDNFRKRSLRERMELLKSAGEDVLVSVLPVIDDFERGLDAIEKSSDIEAVKQGIQLIYNKFKDFLIQRGVKEIEAIKQDFNVDIHEAITKIPAPQDDLKGKVVDVIQKGYYLNEKVIRYAKVVVGE